MIIWMTKRNEIIEAQHVEFWSNKADIRARIDINWGDEKTQFSIEENILDDIKKEWGLYDYEDVFNYIAEELYKKGRVKIPI